MRLRHLLLLLFILLAAAGGHAQSTRSDIIGTVRDVSGSVVSGAEVKVTNLDANTSQTTSTDANGDYQALNAVPGHYEVQVMKSGFAANKITNVELIARQALRVDVTLELGRMDQEISVSADAGVVTTDTPTISASYDSTKILNLPGNFRANGSTSPYALISALPGVQPDTSQSNTNPTGSFSVQGGFPFQSETSVDGISTQNTTNNQPLQDAFPSAESIAEIRVDGVSNPAEYGQPGEITTISKSGSNEYHGSLFWYHQNRALDAKAFGQQTKPQKVANDYGATVGGPVMIPKLYNGKDKTFFFGTYEGFRFPRAATIQNQVPTQALRNGDFNGIGTVNDPLTGTAFPNDVIPAERINPTAQKILALYPLPNAGSSFSAANFVRNASNNYNSEQFDLRGDQYINSKMSVFGRFSYKNITQDSATILNLPSSQNYTNFRQLAVSFNYTIRPNLLNEARFGFTLFPYGTGNAFNGNAFLRSLGFNGIDPNIFFNGLPEIDFNNIQSLNVDRLNSTTESRTYQYEDNLTWTRGRHTMKFGFDIRSIEAITPLGFFGADNYGTFLFNGGFTGQDLSDFLLGLPSETDYDVVRNDNDGQTKHNAVFAQDSIKMTPRLTLNLGLRYEYHPAYTDPTGNIGNFDPSVPRSGRVVYPSGKESLLAPGFLASFNACPAPAANGAPCTPVVSARQAGIPEGLRFAPKDRILPRFGFAYRPFADDKTVIRGGFGIYNITILGSVFYSLTGTLQSDTRTYNNQLINGRPAYAWPNISAGGSGIVAGDLGTAYFGTANDIHWKDPYSMQWNFTLEREIASHTGVRASYIGMRTNQLVWAPNLNQLPYSTQYAITRPLSDRPFPNWGVINTRATGAIANYHSAQLEISRRLAEGLTFDTAYTFARNLADNAGPNPGSFAGENGGGRSGQLYDRHAEYGNVYGTRKHRWITTAVYDLPVGRGRQFGSKMNRALDAVAGGWRLSNIFLWESGPYVTPYFTGGDPSGTGSGIFNARPQHPDVIGAATPANQNRNAWLLAGAFACPGFTQSALATGCNIGTQPGTSAPPIGRDGNLGVGVYEGPGTITLSTGLSKYFAITERFRLKLEGSFTNIANHTNLADPVLSVTSPSFGQITSARFNDFSGYRTGQVSVRLEF